MLKEEEEGIKKMKAIMKNGGKSFEGRGGWKEMDLENNNGEKC